MALKSALGETGFALWDNWSAQGFSDYDRAECKIKWKSFRGDGLRLGTIFYHAKANGPPLAEIRQTAKQSQKG